MTIPKYVYICSMSYSGSTLLDLLLGGHSKLFSLGELSFLSKNVSLQEKCTCGEVVTSCAFWKEVFKHIYEEKKLDIVKHPYSFDLGYALAGNVIDKTHQTLSYRLKTKCWNFAQYHALTRKKLLPLLQPFLRKSEIHFNNTYYLYDTVRKLSSSPVVTDSSKNVLRATGLYLMRPEEFKILLLVRDIRGVAWSYVKKKHSLKKSVSKWTRFYERAVEMLSHNVNPKHIQMVSYESLCTEPDTTLKKICDFIGLDYEESMVDFRNAKQHSVNGNVMRFRKGVNINLDTSWQTGLTNIEQKWISEKIKNAKYIQNYFDTIS